MEDRGFSARPGMGRTGNAGFLDSSAGEDSGARSLRRGLRPQNGSFGSGAGKMNAASKETTESGFTLIETLVALALMGLVLSALASLTAQWLPNWNRGLDRIQRSEMISMALQQIGADLAAAEYV